ncbi:MAG TPA: hypothetical protein VHO24_20845 [Opitutaceae bacterium]|nr:hypothetical protein [Opitutaceae bacterium]
MRGAFSRLTALLVVTATAVLAHDPLEITADVRLAGEWMEVTITQSRFTALALCAEATGGRKTFGPNQFDEVKPALEKCARGVFPVSVAGRKLVPKLVEATLTRESDIEFRLVFPRPAKGPVQLDAALLRTLKDPGYGVLVTVIADHALVVRRTLHVDDSTMEAALPTR